MKENEVTQVEFNPFGGPEIIRVAPSIEPQLEIWISCLLGGEDANRSYNESISLQLTGVFNRQAMELALQGIIERHEALRSSFSSNGTQILIYKDWPLNLDFQDLSGRDHNAQQDYIDSYNKKNALAAFDLLNGPLFRFALFKLAAEEHHLTIVAHHIICDGWSLGILLQDISKMYSAYVKGQVPALPPAPLFSQYSVQQWEFSQTEAHAATEKYWIDQYRNNVPVLDMPTDYPRPEERTYKSHRDDYALSPELVASIKKMGARAGCSLVTTLVAAYEAFLHRITGQSDIVLGIPAAGQSVNGLYGLVGHCVNLLPLRSNPQGELSFIDYLRQRKPKVLDDFEQQQFTFGSLLKKLNIPRDSSRVPLVPLVFNIDMGLDDGVAFEGLRHRLFYNPREFESFEIFINASGSEHSLVLEWSYNTQLYSAAGIRRLMNEFESLLHAVVANPALRIKDIPLVSKEELMRQLRVWNDTSFSYPKETELTALISATAAAFPEKPAIRFGSKDISYQYLNETANQFARFLKEKQIGPGDIVALAVNRSAEMVIALLAILKSGAAYLPIDPQYPEERIGFMLADSSAKLVISSRTHPVQCALHTRQLFIEDAFAGLSPYDRKELVTQVSPSGLAYLLYTSGSTGKPKGVRVARQNLLNLLCSMQKMPGINQADKLLAVTTISFDIAALEIFLPLLTGALLVLANEEESKDGSVLLEMLKKEQISIIQATPSTYRLMLDAGWEEQFALKILCGGEPLSKDLAAKLLSRCAELYNMYGPTETTIYSAGTRIWPQDEIITIGRPIGNTQVYILDEYGNPLSEGLAGEIYIGGEGVSLGYLNRPELQEEKFVPDTFSGIPGAKMYRTGDIGKFMSDGKIQCFGRMDHQVKIRGHRIEPGEIEFKLSKIEGIKEVLVMGREDSTGGQKLVAYVVRTKEEVGNETESIKKWREMLKESVPFFMIPNDFVILSRFPLTPNGKIDRKQLPEPVAYVKTDQPAETLSGVEAMAAAVWASFLQMEKIGSSDDFFALGGHSLIAAQVVREMEKKTGKKLPVTTLFKYPTLRRFAAQYEEPGKKKDTPHAPSAKNTSLSEKIFVPATESQMEIWLACILGGDDASCSYNVSISEQFNGHLDRSAMERALQELIDRHESLRATFSDDAREICIRREQKLDLYFKDLSDLDNIKQQAFIEALNKKNAETVFDLINGPLYRFSLLKLNDQHHYLNLVIHHIICDGWSLGILIQELSTIYSAFAQAQKPVLAEAPKFSQFALEQLAFTQSAEFIDIERYWVDQFRNEVPVLKIPTDFERPSFRTYKSHREDFALDPQLVSELNKIGIAEGCSLAISLRVAFEVFIYHLTGQDDIVVGLSAAGQLNNGYYGLVGHCVNLLPIRSTYDRNLSFSQYLKKRKIDILDAYDHQQLSFGGLLKKLNMARDKSRVPLVPLVFNIELEQNDAVKFYGLEHEMLFNPRSYETFDIFITTAGSVESPSLLWSYNTQLFEAESISRMMKDFEFVLKTIITNPAASINEVRLLSRPQITSVECAVAYPKDKTIVDLFAEQVRKTPGNIAVVFEDRKLTYRDLDISSNHLAHYLRNLGVKEDSLVPICLNRSLDMIIGIMGILKAGGAYVPMDPEYPADRISYMIEDTRASVLVCDADSRDRVSRSARDLKIVCLDADRVSIDKTSGEPVETKLSPDNLAYVIYTSGSTGRPKGVMIEHRNVVRLFKTDEPLFDFGERDVWTMFHSFCFDFSVWEMYGALFFGGRVIVVPKDVAKDSRLFGDLLISQKVTVLNQTPSAFYVLQDYLVTRNEIPAVRYVIFGGEALNPAKLKPWKQRYENCRLINMYGITETTVHVSFKEILAENLNSNSSVIGKPIPTLSAYVLDSRMQLVSAGMPGELYIAGAGLARAYLNLPELTAQRFIKNPFSGNNDFARLYKTGDLAKWLSDGSLEYLGRIDDQVKIRGYRIELGEIENVLLQYPGVKHCVVIASDDSGADKRLIAYTVTEGSFNKAGMTAWLESKLPDYMVPRLIVPLNKIPLTDNGKVDRKALPKPDQLSQFEQRKYVAPQTAEQKIVAEVLGHALGLERVSLYDDFFELGGHSLIAVKVMKSLEEKTGQKLPITSLFEAPTVDKLSLLLCKDKHAISWKSLVPIKAEGTRPPLYIIHGSGLTVMVFNSLAKGMDPDQPVYGLQARGLNGIDEPFDRMEDIASYYISEILAQNPDGPYCLAGYSFGGIVAYEMAKQLKALGKEIKMLAIFDTYADNSDNFVRWGPRMLKKAKRQIPKFRFIMGSLFRQPYQTLKYQSRFFQNRFVDFLASFGLHEKRRWEGDMLEHSAKINEKHFIASQNYRMTAYDGVIDLFRVKTRLNYLDDRVYLGWKPFAKDVQIHEIPGDHRTFLMAPNDRELAKVLRAILEERLGANKETKAGFTRTAVLRAI